MLQKTFSKVYAADVIPLKNKVLFHQYYEQMSPLRQQKINNLQKQNEKCLSLGIGILLSRAYSELDCIPEKAITSKTDSAYIEQEPELKFALSHSGTKVLCAASTEKVGCAVEEQSNAEIILADRFFTPFERSLLSSMPSRRDKKLLFTRIWSLKKSFLSITDQSLPICMTCFSIDPTPNNISITQHFDENAYSFYEFAQIEDCCCSCCLRSGISPTPEFELVNF